MRAGAVALLLAAILPAPARPADLFVTVTGVRSDRGMIAVAVCDKAHFLRAQCPCHAAVAAKPGQVTVRVPNVPPGTWAVEAYHDEAGAGRLEFSLLGMPKQGFGFSRDAPMHFGPPRFAEAAFTLSEADGALTVPLHYPPR